MTVRDKILGVQSGSKVWALRTFDRYDNGYPYIQGVFSNEEKAKHAESIIKSHDKDADTDIDWVILDKLPYETSNAKTSFFKEVNQE